MKVSIQGELGSNSHLAARALLPEAAIVPCGVSVEALEHVLSGQVDGCVLPIENSLHGSVLEHYDLLLTRPLSMVRELNLPIRHNLIALPGADLAGIHRVFSHPVALSQCRRWLAAHPAIDAVSFYDTAGGVKHILEQHLDGVAAIAPALAAEVHGGEILIPGIEDHAENYTRFHLIVPRSSVPAWIEESAISPDKLPLRSAPPAGAPALPPGTSVVDASAAGDSAPTRQQPDKMSLAFAVEHRPGTLVAALARLAGVGADLTKIESRPVPGRPWEYVFYVDLRFPHPAVASHALEALRSCCGFVVELGRYPAARI